MPSKPEKWDYIISGRPYGIMRMAIVGILAAFFIVLTIDQLQPGPNKVPFVALAFGGSSDSPDGDPGKTHRPLLLL